MRSLACELFPAVIILCTSEKQYHTIMIKADGRRGEFPEPGAASATYCGAEGAGLVVLVALGDTEGTTDREVESILMHEAVHAKQFIFEAIGEECPGAETEAYTIQYLADYLIGEWHYRKDRQSKATV